MSRYIVPDSDEDDELNESIDHPDIITIKRTNINLINQNISYDKSKNKNSNSNYNDINDLDDDNNDITVYQTSKYINSNKVVPENNNIEDNNIIITNKIKPNGLLNNKSSKWINKGEQLTYDDAIQIYLNEKLKLENEYKQIKLENELLKKQLNNNSEKSISQTNDSTIISMTHHVNANTTISRTNSISNEETKKISNFQPMPPNNPPNYSSSSIQLNNYLPNYQQYSNNNVNYQANQQPIYPTNHITSYPPTPPNTLPNYSTNYPPIPPHHNIYLPTPPNMPPQISAKYEINPAEVIVIPDIIWIGAPLWKIPFNGKGQPERRIIIIKKSFQYNSNSKPVSLQSNPNEIIGFIYYPITLIWYVSINQVDLSNARELILSNDTILITGIKTKAFEKQIIKSNFLIKEKLCFSVVTNIRTLDLIADNLTLANQWIKALTTLLSINHNTIPTITSNYNVQTNYTTTNNQLLQPKVESNDFTTKLFHSVYQNNLTLFKFILESNYLSINIFESKTNDTPLMIACRFGFIDIINYCLSVGAKNDPHPNFGQTALHVCVVHNQLDSTEAMLKAADKANAVHAIIDLIDSYGYAPIHYACKNGNIDMIHLLIEYSANISILTTSYLQSCLHIASIYRQLKTLALLLDHGLDIMIDLCDSKGNTALHYSIDNQLDNTIDNTIDIKSDSKTSINLQCAKLLLETAANANIKNKNGQTPYNVAIDSCQYHITKLLTQYTSISNQSSNSQIHIPVHDKQSYNYNPPLPPDRIRHYSDPMIHKQNPMIRSNSDSYSSLITKQQKMRYDSPDLSYEFKPKQSVESPVVVNKIRTTSVSIELNTPIKPVNSSYDNNIWRTSIDNDSNKSNIYDISTSNSINETSNSYDSIFSINSIQPSNITNNPSNEISNHISTDLTLDFTDESVIVPPSEIFTYESAEWHVYTDEETSDIYYLDLNAGHSQWEDPRSHGLIYYDYNDNADDSKENQSDYEIKSDNNIKSNSFYSKGPSPPKHNRTPDKYKVMNSSTDISNDLSYDITINTLNISSNNKIRNESNNSSKSINRDNEFTEIDRKLQ